VSRRSPAELALREILVEMGLGFEEERKFAGHAIDFFVASESGPVLVEANGDRWHRWEKIRQCDAKKLNRVLAAGGLPLGIWWTRLQREPAVVAEAIEIAVKSRRLVLWDWAVKPEELGPKAQFELARFRE